MVYSALKDINEMVKTMGFMGKFIEGIFKNRYALFFVLMIVFLLLIVNLFKSLLKNIPMFRGAGDQDINTYGNVTAWCFAFLSVISIGWQTKGKVDVIISALAGPYGFFAIVVIAIVVFISVYKGFSSWSFWPRLAAALCLGLFIYFFMWGNVSKGTSRFGLFTGILFFFLILGLSTHIFQNVRAGRPWYSP